MTAEEIYELETNRVFCIFEQNDDYVVMPADLAEFRQHTKFGVEGQEHAFICEVDITFGDRGRRVRVNKEQLYKTKEDAENAIPIVIDQALAEIELKKQKLKSLKNKT